MAQWEYVKGSEADFEGASNDAEMILRDVDSLLYYVKSADLDEEQKIYCFSLGSYDAYNRSLSWWSSLSGESTVNTYFSTDRYEIIAERRKVDSLQSRVKDASLQQAFDTVQRPAHYNQSGIECIDAIAASMTPAEFQAYLKGNVQKYLWRYQHKNGVEDCRKAQWYLDRLVKELSK